MTRKMNTNKYRYNLQLASVLASTLLSVLPGAAQVTQSLYQNEDGTRDDYTGTLGCVFQVGSSNVVVSHLGTADAGADGLTSVHSAGIFNASGTVLLGAVTNTIGTADYFTNGVRWVALNPPLMLTANTLYLLAGDVIAGSGDPWRDSHVPTWNTYFVGTNGAATRANRYSDGGASWPTPPLNSWQGNATYGNAQLGYIEIGPALAGVLATNVSAPSGDTVQIVGFASGQPTISYQWYKAPGTLLTGKTGPTLEIVGATPADNGTYFLTATNSLGGSQSANVTLTVSAVPVSITQNPTNVTVSALYPASFFVTASGTAPLYYQWLRNGSPIVDATNAIYSLTASSTNNGDQYSCIASNYFSATPHTATSAVATLTVQANVAARGYFLRGLIPNAATNNWTGTVGGYFTTGDESRQVSHVGYYASQYIGAGQALLTSNHNVGIFDAGGNLLASAVVSNGVSPVVNGYIWAALETPLDLWPQTQYIIAAETFSGVDPWGDVYTVTNWDPYFVGTNGPSSIRTWGGAWPSAPMSQFAGVGTLYTAPNFAYFPTAPEVVASSLSLTQWVGFSVTMNCQVVGAVPVTAQWYKSPATALSGQTNASLTLSNLVVGDSGDYFLRAANSSGTNQSANISLTVQPGVGPTIIQQPISQTNFIHQAVTFSVQVSGTPDFTYQWSRNGSPLAGATNANYVISDAAMTDAANYQVAITNLYGGTVSTVASLVVLAPAAGTYPAGILEYRPLVYLRFEDSIDVFNSLTNALNLGTLGTPLNSFYEGFATPGAGPQPPTFAQFETTNQAVVFDGGATQVRVPPVNLDPGSRTNATIAAWVYLNGPQQDYTGIVFTRNNGSGSGLGLKNDTNFIPNMLQYHWANQQSGFDSQIYVPQNQWVFLALVVEANQGSLYMHDGTSWTNAVNVAAHGAPTFAAPTYVGWDEAAGAGLRQLNGTVDEVMIFGQALSSAQLDLVRQGIAQAALTITPSGNNVIVTWPGGGMLQQAGTVTGPYADVLGAASPHTNSVVGGTNRFYRLKY
jgi:hypothetical protein